MKYPSPKLGTISILLVAGALPWLTSIWVSSIFGASQWIQEPLHESLELTGACIALSVALLLLLQIRDSGSPRYLIWPICALVAMGLLDGAHGIAKFGVTWSWLRHVGTLTGGIGFGLVWLPVPEILLRRKGRFVLIEIAVVVAFALSVCSFSPLLPSPFEPGGYTPAVKLINAFGGLGFFAATVFFFGRYWRERNFQDLAFTSFTMLFGMAGIMFGFSHVWGPDWWLWHGVRLLAYLIVLGVGYQTVTNLYKDIARHSEELQIANLALEQENGERRRVEKILTDERHRFSKLMDQLPAYLILLSPDYRVSFANQFFRDRFGDSHGRRCYDYLFNRNTPCDICETYKVLKTDAPHRWEWTGPDQRQYDIHNYPFRDTNGTRMIMEVGIDITEQKKATAVMREASIYNRSLLESSLDPLVTIGPDGKITDVNVATEKATGCSRDHLIGTDFSDYFTEPEQARTGYQRVFSEGSVRDYPLELRRNDGTTLSVLYNASVYRDQNDKVVGVFAAARDITARKLAERAQRESEHLFRSLAESVPQLVWICRPDGMNIYFNQRWMDYTGLTLEQSLGEGWNIPFHPDDKQRARDAWQHSVQTGDIYEIECRLRRSDGVYRWFLTRGLPLKDSESRIVKWFGTCTDIDDLKCAEEQIRTLNSSLEQRVRERTRELETIFNTAPIGLAITRDSKATHIRGNATNEVLFGVPQGGEFSLRPAEGKPAANFQVFQNGRELEPDELPMQRAARGDFVAGQIIELVRHDAKKLHIHCNAAPLINEDQQPCGAIGTFLDITDLKRAEEALRESEERYRRLFDTMQQGVVYQDATGKIISMNAAAVRILGRTPEEFLGQTSEDVESHTLREDGSPFPGKEHPAMVALRTGHEVRNVVMGVFRPHDQVQRWISINATPLFRPGETTARQVYTLFDDITERKLGEDRIRKLNEQLSARASSLERANKELESFSYSVSHDLRAPLRAIDGFSRILLREYTAALPERAQSYLHRVRAASQRMGYLIDDLLALSRISLQQMTLHPVDLSALARLVESELRHAAPDHRVEFIVAPNIVAEGDFRLLRLVFENLLGNAWKFTAKHHSPRVEFGLLTNDSTPACFIRDNGAGFDIANAQNLFGAFQRFHNQTEFPGTGIGLATVQRILHRHGGRIWAEARVNEGATFYFTLPGLSTTSQPERNERKT